MTNEKLYEAIGDISDKKIKEAKRVRKVKQPIWLKWGAMAACLCLLAIGGFLINLHKPVNFNSMINRGSVETAMYMTTIPIDERIACYQQMNIKGNKLEKYVGAEYVETGSMFWYLPEGTNNLKYLIRKDVNNSLTLWRFSYFEMDEGETYTYGDVLTIIYGVDGAEDIVSITTSPMKGNNTAFGKEIQKEVGTQTYTDLEDIYLFYNIASGIICYGVDSDNPADNTRFTYSFSTDGGDKLITGESTYGTRCISVEFTDGTILDSWKYSALSGSFFEYGGIFTEPLAESDVDELNNIFGIK